MAEQLIKDEATMKNERLSILKELITFIENGVYGKELTYPAEEIEQRERIWQATKQQMQDYSTEEIIHFMLLRMKGLMPLNAALLHEIMRRIKIELTSNGK